ncbi:MBG domain-containing protein, partial [Thomasclavelia sp.]|uniref:MBG domain-containing protein n=1 Tax=Thomasclavelia sp. TaxID=3025757 RepID=UPI0025DF0B38
YNGASATKEFTISQFKNEWTTKLSISDWTYGGPAKEPTAKAKFGDVTYTYSNQENGKYTNTVPTDAGTWYVKATVEGNTNYTGLVATKSFKIEKAESTISITTKDMDKTYNGNIVADPEYKKSGSTKDLVITWYVKDGENWNKLKEAPTDVGSYKVIVSVEADSNYNGASAAKEFTISQFKNEWTTKLSISDWTYGEESNDPKAVAKFGDVTFTYSNQEDGEYTSAVPTKAGTWYVKATVEGNDNYTGLEIIKSFEIKKADSTVSITTEVLDKTYDGNDINNLEYNITGSDKDAVITWYVKDGDNWNKLESAPTNVGSYKVEVKVEANDNYNEASTEKEFVISKADNEWEEELSIEDWIYGEKANDPKVSAKFGKVTITYSKEKDGVYTDVIPSEAGIWYVKVTVEGNDNYTGLEVIESFEIKKADNKWKEELTIENWTYGNQANEPKASAKFGDVIFIYSDKKDGEYIKDVPSEVGTWYVKAIVLETENYMGLESEPVEFKIVEEKAVVEEPEDDLPETDKKENGSVNTGDNMNMLLWAGLMMIAGAGLKVSRKKRND